jgi:C4-dicarboxylate-binding protein DctP
MQGGILMGKSFRRRVAMMTAGMFGIGIALVQAPAWAEQINLKIASGHSPSWHFIQLTQSFFIPEVKKRVKERTSHEIDFTEGFSGSMVKTTEVLESLQSGIIDVGMFCICHEAQKLALHNFPMYLPFGPSDPEISIKATRSVYESVPELNQQIEKYGQRMLALVPFEPYNLVSRAPITTAAEVKGRKIGGAGPNLFWVEQAGALPVSVGGPEMYTSFQTGLIDSMIIFLSVMDSLKLFEVAPHFIDVGFGSMSVTTLNVNARRLERLPKEVRDIILEVGREMEGRAGSFTRDVMQKYLQEVEAKGVKVVKVGEDQRKAWATMLAETPNEIGKKFEAENKLPMRKAMRAYIEATEAAGYQWPVKAKLD